MATTHTDSPKQLGRYRASLARPPWVFVRVALGVAVAVVSFGAAGIAFFVGAIATTGCLFECGDRNLLIGIPLLLAAAALVTLALCALWWGFADRHWRIAVEISGTVGFLGTYMLFAVLTTST